jgi:hypothetical protein
MRAKAIRRVAVAITKDHSGDDCPERGDAKTWVIIALLSAALIAILLAVGGPTLALLWNQVAARFG